MRRIDQAGPGDMGLEADLALVSVLFEALENGLEIELLRIVQEIDKFL